MVILQLWAAAAPNTVMEILRPSFRYSQPTTAGLSPPRQVESAFSAPELTTEDSTGSPFSSAV